MIWYVHVCQSILKRTYLIINKTLIDLSKIFLNLRTRRLLKTVKSNEHRKSFGYILKNYVMSHNELANEKGCLRHIRVTYVADTLFHLQVRCPFSYVKLEMGRCEV